MVIVKNRTTGGTSWVTWHTALAGTQRLDLEATSAAYTDATAWNSTTPTSSVFSVGTAGLNTSGNSIIAYCFHSVSGYSSIGSYSGTGASGNTVTTGFEPAFVMIKRTDSAADWFMYDNTRDVRASKTLWLRANYSGAEVDNSAHTVSFFSTGFSVDGTDSGVNASGGTFIYMAFADTRDATFFGDTSGLSLIHI